MLKQHGEAASKALPPLRTGAHRLTRCPDELDYLPDTTAETVTHLLQSARVASMRAAACHSAGKARLERAWNNIALAYKRQATALANTVQAAQQ